jgi:hypothetical protein
MKMRSDRLDANENGGGFQMHKEVLVQVISTVILRWKELGMPIFPTVRVLKHQVF